MSLRGIGIMWARKFIEFKEFIPWLKSEEPDTKLIETQAVHALTRDDVVTSDYLQKHKLDLVKGIALRGDNRPPEKMENGHIPDKCSQNRASRHNDVHEHRRSSDCSGMISLTIKPKIAHNFGAQYQDKNGNYYIYAAKFTKGLFAKPDCQIPYSFEAEVTVRPNNNEIVGYTQCSRVKNICNAPYLREDLSNAEKHHVSAILTAGITIEPICTYPHCFDSYDLYEIYSTLQSNFLTGVSLTAGLDALETSLKKQNYTSETIYWISQFLRGLTFLALGSSLCTTISLNIFNFFLKEYLALDQVKANYLTRGTALALNAITSPFGMIYTSITISANLTGSIAGSYAYDWAKRGFFALKNAVSPSNMTNVMPPLCLAK
jgi:hypothetical protein